MLAEMKCDGAKNLHGIKKCQTFLFLCFSQAFIRGKLPKIKVSILQKAFRFSNDIINNFYVK